MDPFPAYGDRDRESTRSVDLVAAAKRLRGDSIEYRSIDLAEVGRSRPNSLNGFDLERPPVLNPDSHWHSQASTPRVASYDGNQRHISLQSHCHHSYIDTSSGEDKAPLSPVPLLTPVTPPETPAPTGPPEIHFSTFHEIAFIATVCFAQFLSLASLAQTVAPLLIIGTDLGVSNPAQLAWFTASFSMSLGTFIMPAGRIGDIIGHKKVYLIGWLWFGFWAMVAGFSFVSGPIMFSICRALQGIGPALLLPNAMAIIGRTYPIGLKRNIVFSILGACGPTGFFFGALFSSLLAQLAYWPWAFWALTVVCFVMCFVAYLIIPHHLAQPATPPGVNPPTFDYLGAFNGVAGLILINFALNQAPLVGWQTPYVYFTLIIGFIMISYFILIELRLAKSPIIPIKGLQPQAAFALAIIAAGWASHGIWIYYLYLFILKIRLGTPLLAAAETIPIVFTGPCFALSTGFLLRKMHVSVVMMIAMLFFFVGTALLAFAPADQSYWGQTFISVLIMPGGMNLSFPAGTILLSNLMPKNEQGKAASMVSTVVNYSIATGLGLAGTVERHVNDIGMSELEGYRAAWYMGMGLSGVGVVISAYFFVQSRVEMRSRRAEGGKV